MNILIVGAGGREHTIAWKATQSPLCDKLFVAPGNAGTAQIAENVAIGVSDFDALAEFSINNNIELIVVGPEEPLVKGIVDYFAADSKLSHIKVFGPGEEGAQLEGSKDYSKEFMFRHNIPTAKYRAFDKSNVEEGVEYISKIKGNVVLKADGLAAGKGVIITDDNQHAQDTFKEMILDKKFGEASSKVVIEEFLDGLELSVFVITDGKEYAILPEAKDYKRIGEGDTGLNTGGMGALSPVPFASDDFMKKIEDRIVKPTIDGLAKENISYRGFIFFGLIKVDGEPQVIEYNVRMGDPETEVVLLRLENDLIELINGAFVGTLGSQTATFTKEAASTVMLVAGGYPEAYEKGDEISGFDKVEGVIPFHAGTTTKDGKVVTNGGRVIAVSALGNTIADALDKSNKAAQQITWKGRYYRTDLGFDIINK